MELRRSDVSGSRRSRHRRPPGSRGLLRIIGAAMALSQQRRTSRAELGSRRRNLLDDGRARTLRTSHHTAAQRLAGPPTDEVLPGTSRPSGQPPWHRRRLRQRSRSPITVRGSISLPGQIPPSAPSARSALGATSNCRRHDSRSRPAESGIPARGIPARGIPARVGRRRRPIRAEKSASRMGAPRPRAGGPRRASTSTLRSC